MRRIEPQFARNGDASLSPAQGRSASQRLREKARFLAQCFLIWEIPTRVVRFLVPADAEGNMPVERVAGMLAMHCLALNRRLEDFEILILPESSLPSDVTERAKQLITVGRSVGPNVKLSAREQTVLHGIIQRLSNKEIASKLNVSVRTVKFHVSSLLAKFDVPDRVALGRQAITRQITNAGSLALGLGTAAVPRPDRDQAEECFVSLQVPDFR